MTPVVDRGGDGIGDDSGALLINRTYGTHKTFRLFPFVLSTIFGKTYGIDKNL